MTFNQLQYFYEAATLQHFNQASEKLNISEPSLSRAISSLESELNLPLFEKKGRNVVLTKAGAIFLEYVVQILNDIERAQSKMQQLATDGGHINISYVAPLARTYIPKTVRAFLNQTQNRNVTFNFFQNITALNIQGLKNGSYDLIFGSRAENEPTIEFVPIIHQNMVVILPKGHPLSGLEEIDPLLFETYPLLSYDKSSGLGQSTRDYFNELDIHPQIICESPDENAIASLVAHDFGIALVADVDIIHREDIIIRPLISSKAASHTVYMGYIRGKYQLPAIQRFIEYIRCQTTPI